MVVAVVVVWGWGGFRVMVNIVVVVRMAMMIMAMIVVGMVTDDDINTTKCDQGQVRMRYQVNISHSLFSDANALSDPLMERAVKRGIIHHPLSTPVS